MEKSGSFDYVLHIDQACPRMRSACSDFWAVYQTQIHSEAEKPDNPPDDYSTVFLCRPVSHICIFIRFTLLQPKELLSIWRDPVEQDPDQWQLQVRRVAPV